MEEVLYKRIIIKSGSGYVPVSEAYHEKLELTPCQLSYSYTPYVDMEENPYESWACLTHRPEFDRAYDEIQKIVSKLPDTDYYDEDDPLYDFGTVSLSVIQMDNNVSKKDITGSPDEFNRILDLIRGMIPFGENVWPVFLREHYEEEEKTAG